MENEKDIYICPTDGKKFKRNGDNTRKTGTSCRSCYFNNATEEARCKSADCIDQKCYYTELPDNENE